MNKDFKLANYNSVSPYFIVNGAQKFIDLLTEIFDAKELRRYDMPDGTIMHTEIQIDDSVIMLGDSSDKFPSVPLVMRLRYLGIPWRYKVNWKHKGRPPLQYEGNKPIKLKVPPIK